jgi:DAK2 domain fusion protein YloV
VPTLDRLGVVAIRETITTYRDAVRDHAALLDRLNVYPVPDGDTGTNMARTLDAVVAEMDLAPAELSPTCRAIAHGSLMGARGNSGVILSQILRGLSRAFEQAADVDPGVLAAGLVSAAADAYRAVLEPVEGTILTVVREAAAAADRVARAGGTLVEVLGAAQVQGEAALERTTQLLPVLRAAGVVDAGGAGFLLLLDAALHVVDGRPLPAPVEAPDAAGAAREVETSRHPTSGASGSGPRFEVMYLLDLGDEHVDDLRLAYGALGESVVVVGGDGLWSCHVHTDDIGGAIEAGLANGGRPAEIRVTDLFGDGAPAERTPPPIAAPGPIEAVSDGPPATAIVAVAMGDGVCTLLRRAGVAEIVVGGQTMNPSTAELLHAVEAVAADPVILLPNNGNIVAVSLQVAELASKDVRVVPTRSVPEALAALVSYDPSEDVDVNAGRMTAASGRVRTGEVTQAVRDATTEAGPVAALDWIGLVVGTGVVAVAPTLTEAAVGLLRILVGAGDELLTVVEGVGASAATTASIERWMADHRPDVEIERHDGGQPLYPYLFGVE